MKKILVIGSAVADVIIRLEDHLPVTGEDVHVLSQELRPGGCAFNVFDMIRHFGESAVPFFPVGTGPYAEFMAGVFRERGIISAAPRADEPNGCCYCFIEAGGERTFVVYHGAEYRFRKEWFDSLDTADTDLCYVCGLEIEEHTGPVVVDFLERNPHIRVFFAPGPRIARISRPLLRRIFDLHPILHLNETEAEACAGIMRELYPAPEVKAESSAGREEGSRREAGLAEEGHRKAGCAEEDLASCIYRITGQAVIVTLGSRGSLYYDEALAGRPCARIPACPADQVDAVGAGDAHAGALMSLLHRGLSLPEALAGANYYASCVVAVPGAQLSDAQFRKCSTIKAPPFSPADEE